MEQEQNQEPGKEPEYRNGYADLPSNSIVDIEGGEEDEISVEQNPTVL